MGTATASVLAEQSATAAAAAAARAGVEIQTIADADEAHRVSRLLSEIWARDRDRPEISSPPRSSGRSPTSYNYGSIAIEPWLTTWASVRMISAATIGWSRSLAQISESSRETRCASSASVIGTISTPARAAAAAARRRRLFGENARRGRAHRPQCPIGAAVRHRGNPTIDFGMFGRGRQVAAGHNAFVGAHGRGWGTDDNG